MDLNQVTVEVSDFHESVDFYSEIGLKLIVSERDEYARFELPSGSSTFSLHVADQPYVGNTILYFEVDDVHDDGTLRQHKSSRPVELARRV